MKMNKNLKTLLLSGMATAFSLFHANGQDIEKPHGKAPDKSLPTAVMLVSDMSEGSENTYNEKWADAFNRLSIYLRSRDFNVERIGSGFNYLDLEESSKADSVFSEVSHNEIDDITYIAGHGGVVKGQHTFYLGDKVTRIGENGSMIREKDTTSVNLVKGMASKAHEKGHPFNLIFDSCAGNQLLLDIHKSKTQLPADATILTFSNPEDVTFSGVVATVIRDFPLDAHIGSSEDFQHTYNTHIYDDTYNEGSKYKHGPSGCTRLVVNKDGSYTVFSPYKSFQDRIGKGLSQKEKGKILENYKNFHGFDGQIYRMNKNVFKKNINHVDELMKNSTSFEDVSREDQKMAMRFITHLNEPTSLSDYASFMALNHMRLEARTFSKKQTQKMHQTKTPSINSPR